MVTLNRYAKEYASGVPNSNVLGVGKGVGLPPAPVRPCVSTPAHAWSGVGVEEVELQQYVLRLRRAAGCLQGVRNKGPVKPVETGLDIGRVALGFAHFPLICSHQRLQSFVDPTDGLFSGDTETSKFHRSSGRERDPCRTAHVQGPSPRREARGTVGRHAPWREGTPLFFPVC